MAENSKSVMDKKAIKQINLAKLKQKFRYKVT